jgi:hypothetical protein
MSGLRPLYPPKADIHCGSPMSLCPQVAVSQLEKARGRPLCSCAVNKRWGWGHGREHTFIPQGIGYFEWVSWIQVGIAGGIIVVITIILSSAFPIRTATLVLTTASGETQALTSRDIAGVEQVKLLIEDAFTARG